MWEEDVWSSVFGGFVSYPTVHRAAPVLIDSICLLPSPTEKAEILLIFMLTPCKWWRPPGAPSVSPDTGLTNCGWDDTRLLLHFYGKTITVNMEKIPSCETESTEYQILGYKMLILFTCGVKTSGSTPNHFCSITGIYYLQLLFTNIQHYIRQWQQY